MWNAPTEEQLNSIPKLYETEETSLKEKVIYLHFFIGGCDWYISEYNGKDTMFGYAILNNDYEMSEWGYISFQELKDIRVSGWMEVDNDLHFKPKRAIEIDRIRKGMHWHTPAKKIHSCER
jgi:hypothetical protein